MYVEVAYMLAELSVIMMAIAFFLGLVIGVVGYINDELPLAIAILFPGATTLAGAVAWFLISISWPAAILLTVVFTVAYLVKRRRTVSH